MAAMSDPYFNAIQEQWNNIRALYQTYGNKKPIILYDLQEKKIYAYPYQEFKAELSEKSQASLEHDYKSAAVPVAWLFLSETTIAPLWRGGHMWPNHVPAS
jgi:hypothetical protein